MLVYTPTSRALAGLLMSRVQQQLANLIPGLRTQRLCCDTLQQMDSRSLQAEGQAQPGVRVPNSSSVKQFVGAGVYESNSSSVKQSMGPMAHCLCLPCGMVYDPCHCLVSQPAFECTHVRTFSCLPMAKGRGRKTGRVWTVTTETPELRSSPKSC